ncbi:MAG: hypothetical protein OXR62_08695 [Ahrensia sp.]|nr:hypothetical protein [Ahrensia sp.]
MCELRLPDQLIGLAERRKISARDVRMLRSCMFGEQRLTRHEVESLLALDRSIDETCSSWDQLLIDAFANHLLGPLSGPQPVTKEDAEWFIHCISQKGVVERPALFEALLAVMEKTDTVPENLERLALHQVQLAVLSNRGPLAVAQNSWRPRAVAFEDVELIRRILFIAGGDEDQRISRMEAEFLLDLNDATISDQNDETWSDLFVRAIANHVVATSDEQRAGRFASLIMSAGVDEHNVWDVMVSSLRSLCSFNQLGAKRTFRLSQQAGNWLYERIRTDNRVDANERALLAFVERQTGSLPPHLRGFAEAA